MNNELLLDYSKSTVSYRAASKGKRFANYLIDRVFIMLLMLGGFALLLSEEMLMQIEEMNFIIEYLLGAVAFIIYYTICETLLRGKTIGKLVTGTRAVSKDNQNLDFGSVFIRSISRVVPFEAFSFLGDGTGGWHDDWSDSKVIDERNPLKN